MHLKFFLTIIPAPKLQEVFERIVTAISLYSAADSPGA